MKKHLASLFCTLALMPLAHAELKVASLSTITSDIAKNVGGDTISLTEIVKPGIDPHDFQPSPGDIKAVAAADLVLITGKHIEGYLSKLEQSAGGEAKFVDTGKAIPSLEMTEDGQKMADPHWWHSVENMKKAAAAVRDAFVQADPAHATTYKNNAEDYLDSLNALEKWAKVKVAELPRDQRKLVTSHDAFQYFAHEFGFTIYAVAGVGTDDEPSSKNVSELIRLIKEQGVKAVFAENIENPKVLQEITRETGAKLGGELYADGLGVKEARTFDEMTRHNISTIVNALK